MKQLLARSFYKLIKFFYYSFIYSNFQNNNSLKILNLARIFQGQFYTIGVRKEERQRQPEDNIPKCEFIFEQPLGNKDVASHG